MVWIWARAGFSLYSREPEECSLFIFIQMKFELTASVRHRFLFYFIIIIFLMEVIFKVKNTYIVMTKALLRLNWEIYKNKILKSNFIFIKIFRTLFSSCRNQHYLNPGYDGADRACGFTQILTIVSLSHGHFSLSFLNRALWFGKTITTHNVRIPCWALKRLVLKHAPNRCLLVSFSAWFVLFSTQ